MVNLVSPPTLSQMQFWGGLWAHENEPRLSRRARQRLLDQRDRQSGLQWIWACNGEVPSNAVRAGGSGRHSFYIGRAYHQGSVTPGKIVPSRKACCIPWGGDEHDKKIYEVLCGTGKFVSVTPDNTEALLNASSAGMSENGEPLFVGRVQHEGILTNGKVQRSHGVCYIAHEGKELAFKEYEVFVASPPKTFSGHYWVRNDGDHIPENAYTGGVNINGNLFVGRALHRNSCVPGYIDPITKQCHIAWGSDQHIMDAFEYLCNFRGKFVPTKDNRIPIGAIRGGYSEFGEPLFIGRVQRDNQLIIGKVQPSHSVCYIPHRQKEVAHKKYEILVLEQN